LSFGVEVEWEGTGEDEFFNMDRCVPTGRRENEMAKKVMEMISYIKARTKYEQNGLNRMNNHIMSGQSKHQKLQLIYSGFIFCITNIDLKCPD